MKIAFLSHVDINLYLFRMPVMKALVSLGYEVYALCPEGEYSHAFEKEGIMFKPYIIQRKSLNPLKEIKTIKAMYTIIKSLDLDVLHNFTVKPNIYGSVAGHFAKVPVIINSVTGMGSYFILETPKAKIVKGVITKLYKMANTKAHAVLFQNADDLQFFKDTHLLSSSKSFLIKGSGIDTDVFDMTKAKETDSLKETLGIQDKKVVLMVARAIWDKGVKEFYEAAHSLSSDDTVFILVGDTDEGNPTCANKEFLISKDVMWLGHRTDIFELTALADVYVLPSYREGLPRTLLEAASMSKAIVTTNAIGCKEVVDDGINGFLVPVKNTHALTQKISILLNDENMRVRFGIKSRQKALKEFDVKIVVQKYLEMYEEMTGV
ncbi:glycosyltransferase family 4 protein [Sulfurimonas sp. MAG313]|nr:glycosyltransferase family 4 protein [Sulfurimonas sp. MAG313]MDF1881430.1 glycosyltransferase family 4 protein [Sulfurimonas sp. MAG313]